jgi:hypothetical protein
MKKTHELGFYESYLKTQFSVEEFKAFENFMRGQTAGLIDGEVVYYFIDVQNFCLCYDIKFPSF